MTHLFKVTFLAAAAVVAMSSLACAETYLNEMGTGDLDPIINPYSEIYGAPGYGVPGYPARGYGARTYAAPNYAAPIYRENRFPY